MAILLAVNLLGTASFVSRVKKPVQLYCIIKAVTGITMSVLKKIVKRILRYRFKIRRVVTGKLLAFFNSAGIHSPPKIKYLCRRG